MKIQKLLAKALEIYSLHFFVLSFLHWRIFINRRKRLTRICSKVRAAKEGKKGWNITLMQLQPFDMGSLEKSPNHPSMSSMLYAQHGPNKVNSTWRKRHISPMHLQPFYIEPWKSPNRSSRLWHKCLISRPLFKVPPWHKCLIQTMLTPPISDLLWPGPYKRHGSDHHQAGPLAMLAPPNSGQCS